MGVLFVTPVEKVCWLSPPHLKSKHCVVYNEAIDVMEAYTYLVGIF